MINLSLSQSDLERLIEIVSDYNDRNGYMDTDLYAKLLNANDLYRADKEFEVIMEEVLEDRAEAWRSLAEYDSTGHITSAIAIDSQYYPMIRGVKKNE